MLARANRLVDRRDFARVYSRGRQLRSPLVAVCALPRIRQVVERGPKVCGDVSRNKAGEDSRSISGGVIQSPVVAAEESSDSDKRPGAGEREPRFGISVSKKVGGAVQRNLVKRRLREACRHVLKVGGIRQRLGDMDLVIVARPTALQASYEELVATVVYLMDRVAKEGSICKPGRNRNRGKSHNPQGSPVKAPPAPAG